MSTPPPAPPEPPTPSASSAPTTKPSKPRPKPPTTLPLRTPSTPTGKGYFPESRIKAPLRLDPEIHTVSSTALHAISIATESFIAHLATASQKAMIADARGKTVRKTLQYRDVANAVARVDALEFLGDVVPRQRGVGDMLGKRKEGEGKGKKREGEAKGKKKDEEEGEEGREEEDSDGGEEEDTEKPSDLSPSQSDSDVEMTTQQ